MQNLLAYIHSKINHASLKQILLEMCSGSNELQIQCAYNICIDHKYQLVPKNYYEDLADASGNTSTFIQSLTKQFHLNCNKRSPKYATMLASNIYRHHLHPDCIAYKNKRFDSSELFHEEFIKSEGWLGWKDGRNIPVMWITPLSELDAALAFCSAKSLNQSNFVHEYIGVLRNKNYLDYLTTFDNLDSYSVIISYSEDFTEELYHPNCTIPYGWTDSCSNNLFLSFGKSMDQYGRSFNTLPTVVGQAKERIHKNHFHFDSKYGLRELTDKIDFDNLTVYDRTELFNEGEIRIA